jgi:glycosyltransferase involved in cell wall biosynthesis
MPEIFVVIPALNEEKAITEVIRSIPALVTEIVLVDNGSTDKTAQFAKQAGATVIHEPRKGYGQACLTGIEYLNGKAQKADTIVFMDADRSDNPEDFMRIAEPVILGKQDLVIGSRVTGQAEKGSLTITQRFGNWLATRLIYWLYGFKFTDLGPFRAIGWSALQQLSMQDTNFGWTVEMQAKAVKNKLRILEVPTDYRNRIGKSKISGTIKGSILAGHKIITTIFKCL